MTKDGDGKPEIKIYKKTYRLPALSGGKLDQLQIQIRQRNEHLTKGKLVAENKEVFVPEEAIIIEKEEKRGLFGKRVIKHEKKVIKQVRTVTREQVRK